MNGSLTPLTLTQRLLRFKTMNPPGNEHACAAYLGSLLENAGYTTHYYELSKDRPNLIAHLEGTGTKPSLCFSGHIDTVPLGSTPWQKDPFKGETEGNKVYGRGSTDMKGGIAAMVIACCRLAELSKGNATIMVILSVAEETGCQGARFLAQSVSAMGKTGALIVGEPTSNYPFVGHKGALFIEGLTTGISAHGSMPEQGVNAIYKAVKAVARLQQFEFTVPPHPIYGVPTLNVGTIHGGTNINIVPDQTSFGIDIRTIPGQNNKEVFEALQSYLGDEVTLTCTTDADGVSTDPDNEWIQDIFTITEPYLKEHPVARGATYFTDASALAPALGNPPTVILGPGEPEMAHKTDEYCYISRIEEATEIYTEIAMKWSGL